MTIKPEGGDLLLRLMSAATMRRDVLANNLASQNMPGYRRRDVVFEEHLRDALQKGGNARDLSEVAPTVDIDFTREARADGNNVLPEQEQSMLKENRFRFELYAMLLEGRTSLISQAINGDR